MKRVLLAVVLCANLYANTKESQNIVYGSAYGEQVVNENSLGTVTREKKTYYKEEVIFNYVLMNNRINQKPYEVQKISLLNKIEEEKATEQQQQANTNETITVVGYCNVAEDIDIGVQPGAGYFDCSTNIGYVKVFGNLTPINEVKSVVFDPLYLDFKKTRFKVLEGSKTTNEAKTSYNIATFVNDRKISEIALSSTIVASDEIKSSTHEYLAALRESRKKQQTDYAVVNGETIAVQNTNVEKPQLSDFYSTALINIGAGIVKTTAEVFKKDLPYLYQITKNSKIYIDLKINKNGEIIK